MQNMLKNKIIIYFSLFGALFALILGAFSGSFIGIVILRAITGGVLMGGIGFGFDFFLKKALSEEDYNKLLSINEASISIDKPVSQRTNTINVLDDENISNEKGYESLYKNNSNPTGNETSDQIKSKLIYNQVSELNEKHKDKNESYTSAKVSSQQEPFAGKSISPGKSTENNSQINFEADVFSDKDTISSKDDLIRLKDVITEEKIKKSSALKPGNIDGAIKFKVKNKNVTADPEIIAKAIKTVLHRD